MRLKIFLMATLIILLSLGVGARVNVGIKVVLSGNILPTLTIGYEHESGHGLQITAGVLPGGKDKFLLRGELGYTYRYKNVMVGIGRGITRYGANNMPAFDDHIKMAYIHPLKNNTSFDLGTTLSLGMTGQGLAFWGGVNKNY